MNNMELFSSYFCLKVYKNMLKSPTFQYRSSHVSSFFFCGCFRVDSDPDPGLPIPIKISLTPNFVFSIYSGYGFFLTVGSGSVIFSSYGSLHPVLSTPGSATPLICAFSNYLRVCRQIMKLQPTSRQLQSIRIPDIYIIYLIICFR